MIGACLSHYRITAKLGEGGMGEVFRATDTKLGRDVAIKVLPASFSRDPQSLARFEREAKALAALNHPNVAAIHGFESDQGTHFLVLELVEGDTLNQRLRRGRLPVDEALRVARQIAEAVEAAHAKGIIHRDLKPGNIKFTSEGRVKVLDFGLAKMGFAGSAGVLAGQPQAGERAGEDASAPSPDAPTHIQPLPPGETTTPGAVMGTPAYMSPEQARGQEVDKRADIWSFGVILLECLTGNRLFSGETATDILAEVLNREPDWTALPSNTPPVVQLLLRKCLAKDRTRRLQDIGDARVDLENAIADPSSSFLRLSEGALREVGTSVGSRRLAIVGLVAMIALLAAMSGWLLKPAPDRAPIRQLSLNLGAKGDLEIARGSTVKLSPDGTTLAYLAQPEPGPINRQIHIQRLDQLEATPLPGTELTVSFCFSPDGQWIAFADQGVLKKIPLKGGGPVTLCPQQSIRGLDWGNDGYIVIGRAFGGLARIPSEGGTLEPITTLSGNEQNHRFPQILESGAAVLYTAHTSVDNFDQANIMVQRLPSGVPQRVVSAGHSARFLPSGHLVYVTQGIFWAVPFDLKSLKTRGAAAQVFNSLAVSSESGAAHFDFSADGKFVYVKGVGDEPPCPLEWVDREGKREPFLPVGDYNSLKFSSDGRFLAYDRNDGTSRDIYIYEIERRTATKLTTDPDRESEPIWSPSGKSILFGAWRNGVYRLYWRRFDGSGDEQKLTEESYRPWAWHRDGLQLLVSQNRPGPQITSDVKILHLTGDDRLGWKVGRIEDFTTTRFFSFSADFSPDGRWVAYASNESGQFELYVRPRSGDGGRKQISVEGKASGYPIWSPRGGELLFSTVSPRERDAQVFVARYDVEGETLNVQRPVPWPGSEHRLGYIEPGFDIHPDGKRLLVRALPKADADAKKSLNSVILFENFFEHLNKAAPVARR